MEDFERKKHQKWRILFQNSLFWKKKTPKVEDFLTLSTGSHVSIEFEVVKKTPKVEDFVTCNMSLGRKDVTFRCPMSMSDVRCPMSMVSYSSDGSDGADGYGSIVVSR